ncbi:MAG: Asp-tRNA(Asn)/Glu-tRNA(Gln) amidotransferase subunit GatC [Elusimicrobia bacterium]|nr:Asp-tRNA(Asn)/Glu-tRNA(Gln) amidotransferase subunit GatC [Elusimicrobiota bacterium]
MGITIKDVEHIAELARLELTEDEKKLYAGQLADILGWMEELGKADTSSAAPAPHMPGTGTALREDSARPFEDTAALLKNAPEREKDFFKVKKVIEQP